MYEKTTPTRRYDITAAEVVSQAVLHYLRFLPADSNDLQNAAIHTAGTLCGNAKKTKMNKITYYILITIALTACGRSNNETDKEKHEKLVQQKNEKIIFDLWNKYSIKYSFDTLSYNYSIEFEDLLNTEYQLISDFSIKDIYNQDSISFVKIETGFYPTYYLNLSISKKEQEKLLTLEKSHYSRANAIMVIKLQEIRKIDLTFESYPEDQDYCSIEFESSMDFTGKGQVIEVQILNE